jgi:hypothetical protein
MSVGLATQRLDQIGDDFGADLASGIVEIRSGTRPATADDTATGSLLASIPLNNPAITSSVDGVVTFDVPVSATAGNTGTASWARIKQSGGTTEFDADVGTSGTDIIIDTTSINSGDTVRITAFSFTWT